MAYTFMKYFLNDGSPNCLSMIRKCVFEIIDLYGTLNNLGIERVKEIVGHKGNILMKYVWYTNFERVSAQ